MRPDRREKLVRLAASLDKEGAAVRDERGRLSLSRTIGVLIDLQLTLTSTSIAERPDDVLDFSFLLDGPPIQISASDFFRLRRYVATLEAKVKWKRGTR